MTITAAQVAQKLHLHGVPFEKLQRAQQQGVEHDEQKADTNPHQASHGRWQSLDTAHDQHGAAQSVILRVPGLMAARGICLRATRCTAVGPGGESAAHGMHVNC